MLYKRDHEALRLKVGPDKAAAVLAFFRQHFPL